MKASGDQDWLAQWRREFVLAVQQGETSFAALCRRFRFIEQHNAKTRLPLWQRAGAAIAHVFKNLWR